MSILSSIFIYKLKLKFQWQMHQIQTVLCWLMITWPNFLNFLLIKQTKIQYLVLQICIVSSSFDVDIITEFILFIHRYSRLAQLRHPPQHKVKSDHIWHCNTKTPTNIMLSPKTQDKTWLSNKTDIIMLSADEFLWRHPPSVPALCTGHHHWPCTLPHPDHSHHHHQC